MNVDGRIAEEFTALIDEGNQLAASAKNCRPNYEGYQVLSRWEVACKHLLRQVYGETSIFYTAFEPNYHIWEQHRLPESTGVLEAAKRIYEGGLFVNLRGLVQAEVFEDFLRQASELHRAEYYTCKFASNRSVIRI